MSIASTAGAGILSVIALLCSCALGLAALGFLGVSMTLGLASLCAGLLAVCATCWTFWAYVAVHVALKAGVMLGR